MHMADALVSPPVATGMAVASLAVGAYSIFKINHKVIFDYLFKSSYMPV